MESGLHVSVAGNSNAFSPEIRLGVGGLTSTPAMLLEIKNCFLVFFFFLGFLGLHPRHMEVPRLGVKPELQLLAYTTVTAMLDPLTH